MPSLMERDDVNADDIISVLPECVLSDILSRLLTKDAVRTSVLSRKWRYMWTGIYNMYLDERLCNSYFREKKDLFVDFVNRVLLLSGPATVREFEINCVQRYNSREVNEWIRTVLRRNVQKLSLHCLGDGRVSLPFYSGSNSLNELVVWTHCTFELYSDVRFSNLKTLRLFGVEMLNIHSSHSTQLLLCFPVLETFSVRDCKFVSAKMVKIVVPVLASFKMENNKFVNDESNDGTIEIYSPGLKSFTCGGQDLENFILPCSSSVVDVAIDQKIFSWNNHLRSKIGSRAAVFLGGFNNVKCLKLSCDVIEALDLAESPMRLPTFGKLTDLEVDSGGLLMKISGSLMSLIHHAPFLRSLRFIVSKHVDEKYEEIEPIPVCISSSLNFLKFKEFHWRKEQVRLVKFFLKNAVVLKEIKIYTYRSLERETELLAFAKSSNNASVIFVS